MQEERYDGTLGPIAQFEKINEAPLTADEMLDQLLARLNRPDVAAVHIVDTETGRSKMRATKPHLDKGKKRARRKAQKLARRKNRR